jgi:hypothetical protein
MSDPRFEESELPAKPDRSLRDRGDRLGLVVASAAFAGVVVLAVLYTQMSEGLKPTPKPSVETLHANERGTETYAQAIRRDQ